ncbi:MAG: hypothetical protein JWL80_225 [Parcubacteria group bacterium]|nr:hypothetical protein [Parcubacteria group bacterium]
MKNIKIIVATILVIGIILGGYFFAKNKGFFAESQIYTNASFGYSINIEKGYEYLELKSAPGHVTIHNPNTRDNQLDINVSAPTSGGAVPNGTTLIDGETAKIYIGTDEHGINRKSYEVIHKGMNYDITFAPLDDSRLEAMARSFRFAK